MIILLKICTATINRKISQLRCVQNSHLSKHVNYTEIISTQLLVMPILKASAVFANNTPISTNQSTSQHCVPLFLEKVEVATVAISILSILRLKTDGYTRKIYRSNQNFSNFVPTKVLHKIDRNRKYRFCVFTSSKSHGRRKVYIPRSLRPLGTIAAAIIKIFDEPEKLLTSSLLTSFCVHGNPNFYQAILLNCPSSLRNLILIGSAL